MPAVLDFLDDRLPISPPDVFSNLYGRLNNPDWNAPTITTAALILPAGTPPSYAFGESVRPSALGARDAKDYGLQSLLIGRSQGIHSRQVGDSLYRKSDIKVSDTCVSWIWAQTPTHPSAGGWVGY